MMEDLLGLGRNKPDGQTGRIKEMVRRHFGLSEDTVLMVSELRCHEDGCPDVETVIAVMETGVSPQTLKIAKRMADIQPADIHTLPYRPAPTGY